jgi:hypothetical protein
MNLPLTTEQHQVSHVCYALRMIAVLPPCTDDSTLNADVQNACIESYLTNLRLLIEFTTRRQDPRDIHRHDFLPGWDPPAGGTVERLSEDWQFASSTVSHLSKSRVPGPGYVMQNYDPLVLAAMSSRVFDVMEAFVEALEDNGHAHAQQFRLGLTQAQQTALPIL